MEIIDKVMILQGVTYDPKVSMMDKALKSANTLSMSERRRWETEIASHKKELKTFQTQIDRIDLSSSSSSSSSSYNSHPHLRSASLSLNGEEAMVNTYKKMSTDLEDLKGSAALAKETAEKGEETLAEVKAQGERMDGWQDSVRILCYDYKSFSLNILSLQFHGINSSLDQFTAAFEELRRKASLFSL